MSDAVQIEAYTTLEQLEQLRTVWGSLSSHLETDLDFFLQVVALRPEFVAPCVLVAKQEGRPAAMLVGRLEKVALRTKFMYFALPGIAIRQFVFVCFGSSSLTAPVAEALVRHILGRLKSHEAERILLSNCICNTPLHASADRLPGPVMRDTIPNVTARWRLFLPESYDTFFKLMDSKKRGRLRHHVNRFEKVWGSDKKIRIFSGPQEAEQFFAETEQIASNSWQRSLGKGFLNNEDQQRRIRTCAGNGWWRAYMLSIKDQPVAFWTGEFYRNEFSLLYTAYDPAYRDYRVGLVLLLQVIADMCGLHARVIDFGVGTQQYKERLCNDFHLETEFKLHAPSLRGILANVLGTSTAFLNKSSAVLLNRLGLEKLDPNWKAHRDLKSMRELKSMERDYAAERD